MSRTALYRFFDAEGDLLYVGISLNPFTRWQQHKGSKGWIADVSSTTIEWFDTREDAERAERARIVAERPRHNIAHNSQPARPTSSRSPESSPSRELMGDWCDRCADNMAVDDPTADPTRFPDHFQQDQAQIKASYCCEICHHRWQCWWGVDFVSMADA